MRVFPVWRFLLATLLTGILILGASGATLARWKPMRPMPFPVERVLENAEKYVKTHPDDPEGYYIIGRIHYYAFAFPKDEMLSIRGSLVEKPDYPLPLVDGNPLGSYETRQSNRAANAEKQLRTQEERKTHIREAEKNLKKALQLQEKKNEKDESHYLYLFPLTLAAIYEEGKTLLRPDWNAKAITYYRQAFDRSSDWTFKEGKRVYYRDEIWREAGERYLWLMKQKGPTGKDRAEVARVERAMKRLTALPESPQLISPIILSLKENQRLTDLIQPRLSRASVSFDLDGTRSVQRFRTWPGPDTAFLVWDPTREGKIQSGQQLFGTATWWMFFSNGYRAMDMLDDNRDGWLTGKELASLSLWFDRNGNGVSESGEVMPIERTGIQGLATNPDGVSSDGSPHNRRGVRLNDGRILPTYDWIVAPEPNWVRTQRRNLRHP